MWRQEKSIFKGPEVRVCEGRSKISKKALQTSSEREWRGRSLGNRSRAEVFTWVKWGATEESGAQG